MLEMAEITPEDQSYLRSRLQAFGFTSDQLTKIERISRIGAFFHDADYPGINEPLAGISKPIIETYVEDRDGLKYLKPIDAADHVGQLVSDIFGYTDGKQLTAMNGINEYYSAIGAATQLHALGVPMADIAAVVSAIEATIAFRSPTRMDELRGRLEAANAKFNLGMTPIAIDEAMVAATFTANKDIVGLIGGLDPDKDTAATLASVKYTIEHSDRLSPEEVGELNPRTNEAKVPGEYKPLDLVKGCLKRAGLHQFAIPGDPQTGRIDKLFHGMTLSNGQAFPPQEEVTRLNTLGYKNNRPGKLASSARLVATALVHALATEEGRQDMRVSDLLSPYGLPLEHQQPAGDEHSPRVLAYQVLQDRDTAGGDGYDISKSPIASLILAQSELTDDDIIELGKATRGYMMPNPPVVAPNAEGFLTMAREKLGAGLVGEVKQKMDNNAQAAVPTKIGEAELGDDRLKRA